MAVTKDEVVEFLKGMTLLEASELVKELEEVFGVSAAAAAAAAETPKTSSNSLTNSDASKSVIPFKYSTTSSFVTAITLFIPPNRVLCFMIRQLSVIFYSTDY